MGLQKRQTLIQSAIGIGLMAATAATLPVLAQSSSPAAPGAPAAMPTSPEGAPMASPKPMASPMAPEAGAPAASTETKVGTIVDVAANNPDFSTLAAAVKAAGLDETLAGKGPFTLFAPTNEAFKALPEGALNTLLKPENKALLQAVLTYHVVPGAVASGDIKPGEVKTVEGKPVNLAVANNKVMVNKAAVVTPDVKATNGVIHVIDKVLIPPDLKAK